MLNNVISINHTPLNSNIIAPFSTNNAYSESEQATINKALDILASKITQSCSNLMNSSRRVGQFLRLKLSTSDREIFAVMFLDNQHHIIKYEEMTVGTVDSAAVYPREVIKRALDLGANAMILAHNHPSGILQASNSDRQITDKICKAAQLMDLRVLDHVIVSGIGTYSFAEHGERSLL